MKIFRLRQNLILAACLAMVLSLAASWAGDAGPLTMPTSAIGNARALARDMATQTRDMTKLIAKLRLEIGLVDTMFNTNPSDSLAGMIEEAENDFMAGEVNDAVNTIGRALQDADLFIELKIGLLLSEAEQLSEDNGSLKGKLQSLVTDRKIRSTPGNNAINKTDVIDSLLQDFVRELEEVRDLIEDGDAGESPCDDTIPPANPLPADACDDIEDWLGVFLDNPTSTAPLDQALLIIREINGDGNNNGDLDVLLKKLTPSTPDSVLPCLIMIDKILKDEQRRGTYRRSSSVVSVTVENNLAHVAIAPEVSDLTDGTVKLWAMDGHWVGEYALHGKTFTLGERGLANGVYYYTASLRRADGTVAQTTVQKLVVMR
ncbi:hypothetical protein HYR54_07980 [Candidatus Acetothermia bacterium]|nr:hypothetical protein [Candidatus Acetothermia bacterium]